MKAIRIKITGSLSESVIKSSWESRAVLLECAETFKTARAKIKHGAISENLEAIENRLRTEAENAERRIGKELLELFLKQHKGVKLA